ncbi:MAG TPA: DUF1080 domain-containing protein [Bryobacteraceae bacterium]|nr:DUF1080 domain-containing protein [Bryobacteraceae bacterium]
MRNILSGLMLTFALVPAAFCQKSTNPFDGRWDFTINTKTGVGANWLGVAEKGGNPEIWFQPTGGHVHPVKDFKLEGSHLRFKISEAHGDHPAATWDLDAAGGKLTGVQKSGTTQIALTGVRAPALKRSEPKAWTSPEALFNGKNLDGFVPFGGADSHWVVQDGLLVNEAHGANLKTTRKFEDFKVHFEANCPNEANSGFYLRGRYEMQLEYEPKAKNPAERRIGAIYGRIAPSKELPATPGQWETFDVTLVGRTVTIVRNGVTTVDHKEIEGITGGALDANEGEPGPFYIQGDHTGGLKFRNITVSVPKG